MGNHEYEPNCPSRLALGETVYICRRPEGHNGPHTDSSHTPQKSWMDPVLPRSSDPTNHVLSGGSTRSEAAPAFYLVPPYGARRTALRFGLGAEKHGVDNWKKSVHSSRSDARAFAEEAYNHMQQHMLKMKEQEDPEDDHLGAIGWAVEVLAFIEFTYKVRWTEL